MRRFRLLKADEIECRINKDRDDAVQILLYKTARVDAAILDEYFPDSWQCDFKALDGKMYGGIGIKLNNEWIWRWDCGSESNMEAEKGEASDAFKRAGFKWGIGTELYSAPQIWIKKSSKGKCRDRFKVKEIKYDENERIAYLEIYTDYNALAFTYDARSNIKQSSVEMKEDAHNLTKEERDQKIAEIVELVQGTEYAGSITKEKYCQYKWDELTDEDLISKKLSIIAYKKKAEKNASK